jgi:hypothetical protein
MSRRCPLLGEADIMRTRTKPSGCDRLFDPQTGLGALLVLVAGGAAHADAAGWPFSRGAGRIADRLTIKRIPPS